MSEPHPLDDPSSRFARLKATCAQDWDAYVNHEFVRRLGDGTLPEASFRHYLIQDYLFLVHFARAWALAVVKADTLDDMRAASASVHALLEIEMSLHVKYCEGWGLSEADILSADEATDNMAYTRFVLERGFSGDVLDLRVALAPCGLGYAAIGRTLAASPDTVKEGNPYLDGINMYAGDEFQQHASAELARLDEIAARRSGEARFPELAMTFRQATRLEARFWSMGLELSS